MKHFVVDASVAMKWFLPETHQPEATRLLDGQHQLHAPDLIFAEVGSIICKHVRSGRLSDIVARGIVESFLVMPLMIARSVDLLSPALALALASGRSVYDSLYLSLALQQECLMVTADTRLANALKGSGLSKHVLNVAEL